jgi:SAM-dependent methyltransferase
VARKPGIGIDLSPRAIAWARAAATRSGTDVAFEVGDVLSAELPRCDVAISSLFLHHLDDTRARGLLGSMAAAARRGLVVSDLIRSRLGIDHHFRPYDVVDFKFRDYEPEALVSKPPVYPLNMVALLQR